LLGFKGNTGFVKAVNAGLKEAEGEYIVILNNDTEVGHGWDKKLLYPLQNDPTVGAVGPITQSRIAWQEASALNKRFGLKIPIFNHNIDKYSKELDKMYNAKYIDTGSIPLAFFCVAIKKSTFDLLGGLDEGFGLGFGDDDEYCWRLRMNKFRTVLSVGTFVYHHHRTTFRAIKTNIDQLRRKNLKHFRQKRKVYLPVVQ
jgi:GT2 family glycosyltransferase